MENLTVILFSFVVVFSVAFPVYRGWLSFFFFELLHGERLSKSSQESTLEGLELSEDSSPLSAIVFCASGEMMTSVKN